MDIGKFNLFIKMVRDEYKLTEAQILKLSHRLLADDREFETVWGHYKAKALSGGVDSFKQLLNELIN